MISTLLAAVMAVAPMQQIDSTLNVRAGGRLDVENQNGSVIVRSWDRDQVRIRTTRRPERGSIEIDGDASSVHVETNSWRGGNNSPVDFEITVPRRFQVGIEGIIVRIEITDIEGDVDAETVAGAVTLRGINGRVRAETVHGVITIRDTRGNLHLENANGNISVTNHNGDLRLEAVNGSIALTGIQSADVNAETVNGAVEYSGEYRSDGRYRLATHYGNLSLVVPEGTNANFSVETFMGEVRADFPIQVRGVGRREQTSFTIGSGGARVQLETFGGQVRLRRTTGR